MEPDRDKVLAWLKGQLFGLRPWAWAHLQPEGNPLKETIVWWPPGGAGEERNAVWRQVAAALKWAPGWAKVLIWPEGNRHREVATYWPAEVSPVPRPAQSATAEAPDAPEGRAPTVPGAAEVRVEYDDGDPVELPRMRGPDKDCARLLLEAVAQQRERQTARQLRAALVARGQSYPLSGVERALNILVGYNLISNARDAKGDGYGPKGWERAG